MSDRTILAWLGLAIALVLLDQYRLSSWAVYTLLLVIVYVLLTNGPAVSRLVESWVRSLNSGTAPGTGGPSGLWRVR